MSNVVENLPECTRNSGIIDVIEWCRASGLPADVVGRWVWIRFAEKPDEATRGALKGAGFRWVHSRGEWAHNCGIWCHHGVGHPRDKYTVVPVSALELESAGAA